MIARVVAVSVWLGGSTLLVCAAYAQSFSDLSGTGGLITLPGMNTTQQMMAQSINAVCPTINTIAVTPGQKDLASICSAMLGTSLQVQGQPNALGFPSYGISADALKGALSQFNGGSEIVVPTSQASSLSNTQTNTQTSVVEERLSLLRDRLSRTSFASLDSPQQSQVAAVGASDAPGGVAIAQTPTNAAAWSGRLGVYVTGIGQFGDRTASGNQNGYSFNNGGFIAGADYVFTPQFVAGLAFGYTHASTDFDASLTSPPGQSISADLFQGNLYGTYAVTDALYLNGMALIGGSTDNSRRQIVLVSNTAVPGFDRFASGNFGTRTYGLSLGGGYNLPLGQFIVTPQGRFDYRYLKSDGFTETGAQGLDLLYGGSSHNTFQSFIGGQVQYPIATRWGVLTPNARFDWAHQYNSGNTTVSVAYSNDPTLLSAFTQPGDNSDKNYFDLGVGLSLEVSKSQTVYLRYDTIVGLSHTSYNSVSGGIRIAF